MRTSFSEQVASLVRARFVGREAELGELVAACLAPSPRGTVVVYGPPGIGKSALLHALHCACTEAALPCALIDLRVVSSAEEIADRARQQLGRPIASLTDLFASDDPAVLLLDHFEYGSGLDQALRAAQLAGSGEVLCVIASRRPVPVSWLRDAEWGALIRPMHLAGLTDEAALCLLTGEGVDRAVATRFVALAAGHPVALVLFARAWRADPEQAFGAVLLDVAESVLKEALGDVGDERERALVAAALSGVASEGTLRAVAPDCEASALFRWIATQPIVSVTPYGLAVHEPFGTFLIESLAWRDPERLLTLRERLHAAGVVAVERGASFIRFPHLLRLLALADTTGTYRRALVGGLIHGLEIGALHRDEMQAALEIVPTAFRGVLSEWLVQGWSVSRSIRQGSGQLVAWTTTIPLEGSVWERAPEAHELRQAIDEGERGCESGRTFVHCTWIDPLAGTCPEQVHALALALQLERVLTLAQPVRSYFVSNTGYGQLEAYWSLLRARPFSVHYSGETLTGWRRDWRQQTVLEWLKQSNALQLDSEEAMEWRPLERNQFAQACAQALRDWSRPERLRGNPLLWSRSVVRHAGAGASESQRIQALRRLLEQAIAELGLRPQYRRWQAVAESAYLRPIAAQERMAEQLGIPFSTYRRYLKSATEWIVDYLWSCEVGELEWAGTAVASAVPRASEAAQW